MKRLLLLISLVTFFVSIPLIAAAGLCPSPAAVSAEEVCKCRLDYPGEWWGEYRNLGDCVSEVNSCNQADVPAVCECKYAIRIEAWGFGPACPFRNLGDCVGYLASMGYGGGALPPCPYED